MEREGIDDRRSRRASLQAPLQGNGVARETRVSENGNGAPKGATQNWKPVYCYQCVAGPDLMKVQVEDGVATRVRSNYDASDRHPGGGRVCVKAYGLIQKTYNPHRIRQPMKRTNPRKGRGEDPGFVPGELGRGPRRDRRPHARDPLPGARGRVGIPAPRGELRGRRHAHPVHGNAPRLPLRMGSDRHGFRGGGRASSAITASTSTASSGIARSSSRPTPRAAATSSVAATTPRRRPGLPGYGARRTRGRAG